MAMIGDTLQAVIARIASAAAGAGRPPGSVRLLAVSKTHPPARIAEAYGAGQRAFGEHYVQEALEKIVAGEQTPTSDYMTGKLKIKGDMGAAMKLQKLF